jgi:hypothetical protein
MQTPAAAASAAAAARPPHRGKIACLSAALAALVGHAAGAELSEDELLEGLREAGQLTYPAPLLGRLLGVLIERLCELLGLLWWLLVRLQEPSPPHRLSARLSGALAEELAGPCVPDNGFPLQIARKDSLADQLKLTCISFVYYLANSAVRRR